MKISEIERNKLFIPKKLNIDKKLNTEYLIFINIKGVITKIRNKEKYQINQQQSKIEQYFYNFINLLIDYLDNNNNNKEIKDIKEMYNKNIYLQNSGLITKIMEIISLNQDIEEDIEKIIKKLEEYTKSKIGNIYLFIYINKIGNLGGLTINNKIYQINQTFEFYTQEQIINKYKITVDNEFKRIFDRFFSQLDYDEQFTKIKNIKINKNKKEYNYNSEKDKKEIYSFIEQYNGDIIEYLFNLDNGEKINIKFNFNEDKCYYNNKVYIIDNMKIYFKNSYLKTLFLKQKFKEHIIYPINYISKQSIEREIKKLISYDIAKQLIKQEQDKYKQETYIINEIINNLAQEIKYNFDNFINLFKKVFEEKINNFDLLQIRYFKEGDLLNNGDKHKINIIEEKDLKNKIDNMGDITNFTIIKIENNKIKREYINKYRPLFIILDNKEIFSNYDSSKEEISIIDDEEKINKIAKQIYLDGNKEILEDYKKVLTEKGKIIDNYEKILLMYKTKFINLIKSEIIPEINNNNIDKIINKKIKNKVNKLFLSKILKIKIKDYKEYIKNKIDNIKKDKQNIILEINYKDTENSYNNIIYKDKNNKFHNIGYTIILNNVDKVYKYIYNTLGIQNNNKRTKYNLFIDYEEYKGFKKDILNNNIIKNAILFSKQEDKIITKFYNKKYNCSFILYGKYIYNRELIEYLLGKIEYILEKENINVDGFDNITNKHKILIDIINSIIN